MTAFAVLPTISFNVYNVYKGVQARKGSMLVGFGNGKPLLNGCHHCFLSTLPIFCALGESCGVVKEMMYNKIKLNKYNWVGVKEFEARWIGWAGVNRCIHVFLDEEIVHQCYNGYFNNILWPLFHYLGLLQEDRLVTTRSFQSQFVAYVKANVMFAAVVNQHYQEGHVVWCHDYHLMFLPKMPEGAQQ
ncbi:hypothetical protein CsSME_00044778 [Camellia sinensis var. sinensis]